MALRQPRSSFCFKFSTFSQSWRAPPHDFLVSWRCRCFCLREKQVENQLLVLHILLHRQQCRHLGPHQVQQMDRGPMHLTKKSLSAPPWPVVSSLAPQECHEGGVKTNMPTDSSAHFSPVSQPSRPVDLLASWPRSCRSDTPSNAKPRNCPGCVRGVFGARKAWVQKEKHQTNDKCCPGVILVFGRKCEVQKNHPNASWSLLLTGICLAGAQLPLKRLAKHKAERMNPHPH